ncbi:B12-binding domain-containing radical SAM protein [Candidatus Latescibacterota bacterium]
MLVIPNYTLRDENGPPTAPPIGPALVASSLRDEGYQVSMIDADAENLSDTETVQRVIETNPDAIGFSCNYISKHNPTIDLAKQIKKQADVFTFAGGNHISAYTEPFLTSDKSLIDVVLKGEGEVNTPLLMRALSGKIGLEQVPGATINQNGRAVTLSHQQYVDNLDSLSLPAYDLLPMDIYSRNMIISSRGCPFSCSYCASTCINGTKVRLRSAASIIDEINYTRSSFGDKFFWFSDDTFAAVKKHVTAISLALTELENPIRWSCLANAARLTDDTLAKMKNAGCEYLSIGVESTHPDHKKFIGKPINDEMVIDAVKKIHDNDMRAYGFFIIGFPGENEETLESRYRLIEKARFDDVAVNLLILLPGTQLWDELVHKGLLDPETVDMDQFFARIKDDMDKSYSASMNEKWCDLTAEELLRGVEKCRELGKAASPEYRARVYD